MAKEGPKFVDQSLVKQTPKERAKSMASGEMPDDWDYENIRMAIHLYNKRYPGRLEQMFKEMALEVAASGIDYHASLAGKGAQGEMRRNFSLPQELYSWMEIAYPTIIFGANKRHVAWFMRKFPKFSWVYYTNRQKVKK